MQVLHLRQQAGNHVRAWGGNPNLDAAAVHCPRRAFPHFGLNRRGRFRGRLKSGSRNSKESWVKWLRSIAPSRSTIPPAGMREVVG